MLKEARMIIDFETIGNTLLNEPSDVREMLLSGFDKECERPEQAKVKSAKGKMAKGKIAKGKNATEEYEEVDDTTMDTSLDADINHEPKAKNERSTRRPKVKNDTSDEPGFEYDTPEQNN